VGGNSKMLKTLAAIAAASLTSVNAATILEYAIETEELSDLVALLQNDTQYAPVLTLLNATDANVTLFAPTNAALAKFTATPNLDLVLYHTILAVVPSTELQPLQFVPAYDGTVGTLQITSASNVQIVFGVPGNIATTATVTIADLRQDNGIVHLIDTVLVPPAAVSATAVGSGVLTGLVSALTEANLVAAVDGLPASTVFAPADPAFSATGIANLTLFGLTTTLTYHVLDSVAYSTQIVPGSYTTLSGDAISVTQQGAALFVNGARVLVPNVLTATGVVHVIESVLQPPASTRRSMVENLALAPDLTTLSNILIDPQYADIKAALDGATNFTVFAPTDVAFAALPSNLTPEQIAATLQYHVSAAGKFESGALAPVNIVPTLLTGPASVVNLNGTAQVLNVQRSVTGVVTVNTASTVVRADVNSANDGVAHVVDAVVGIPADVVSVATAAGLTSLLDAVVYAGLAPTVANTPSLTIFAPTNAGFEAFASSLGVPNVTSLNVSVVEDVLKQHVVGAVTYSTELFDGQVIESVQGAKWNVTISAGVVRVGGAIVEKTNVQIQNGVVHVIDRVLGGPAPATTTAAPSPSAPTKAPSVIPGLPNAAFGAIVAVLAVVGALGCYCKYGRKEGFTNLDDIAQSNDGDSSNGVNLRATKPKKYGSA